MSAKKRTPIKPEAAAGWSEFRNASVCGAKEPMKEAFTPPLVTSSKDDFTPMELAQLAATIDPAACKTDNPSPAVIKALELIEKCGVICTAIMAEGSGAQVQAIGTAFPQGSEFAQVMGKWIANRVLDAQEKVPDLTSEALPERPIEMSFDEAVQRITGMQRSERAMSAFRKWMATQVTEAGIGKEMDRLRREMTTVDLACMSAVFPRWYKRHRSEVNKGNAKTEKPTTKKNLRKKAKKSLDGKIPRKK